MLILALALAGLAAGCGGGGTSATGSSGSGGATPKPGGTLQISQGEEVVTLDPLKIIDLSSINVSSLIVEPLFIENAESKIEPLLVEAVKKSKDQKVWTFQLRKGVKFSTGQPMTSADVLFTLEQARKSELWAPLLAGIEKVTAPSPTTIVITNKEPAPELEARLSQWSFGIMPKNWGGETEAEFAQHPIGTGPFVLKKWNRGQTLTLAKNQNYWNNQLPYLNEVVFHTVSDSNSRVDQLKAGQLEVISSPPWPQLEAIGQTPGLEVGEYPLGSVEFLVLNSRIPLFQNQKAREAVKLAIDRPGLASAVLGGQGEAAGGWIPPALSNSNQEIEVPEQNLSKAKALLKEAVAEGVQPTFHLLINTNEYSYWESASQIIQQNLSEVGFHVQIQNVDYATASELSAAGKFDVLTTTVLSSTPGPAELIAYYNATEGLYAGVSVAETTKGAEEAESEVDPVKRKELWYEVQEDLVKEDFLLPLTYSPYSWALADKVRNFVVNDAAIPLLSETWLEE